MSTLVGARGVYIEHDQPALPAMTSSDGQNALPSRINLLLLGFYEENVGIYCSSI